MLSLGADEWHFICFIVLLLCLSIQVKRLDRAVTWVLRNLPPCHLHSCGMQLIPPDLQVSISLRCFKRGLPAQNSGWATHAELRYAEKLLTSCASQPLVRELRVSRPASWNPRSDIGSGAVDTVPAAHSNLKLHNYHFTYNPVNHFYNFLDKIYRACIASFLLP